MTPEERKRDWAKRQRQQDWARRQAQQPQPEPPGFIENVKLSAERGYRKYLEPAGTALVEATQGMQQGDFGPAWQMVKEVGRGMIQSLTPPDPQFQRDPQTGTFTQMQMRPPDPLLQEAQAKRTARYQASPQGQRSAQRLAELDARAALDPSLTGKAVRGATEFLTGAAPTLAAAIATRGAILPTAFVAAAQSANNPGQMGPQAAAGLLPVPVGKAVAGVLRRIRGAKAAAVAADGAAAQQPAPLSSMLSAPHRARIERAAAVSRGVALDEGPPGLEADFGVSAAPTVSARSQGVSMRGPAAAESAALDIGADPSLATAAERTPILQTVAAFYKAGLLTGAKTHLKNVAGTGGFQLSEELSRIPGAVADMIMSAKSGRRTISGPSLDSMRRSSYEAATVGMREAWQAIKTGRTRFDPGEIAEIASGSKTLNTYINGVFRVLKAEDAVFKTYAFRRSLEDRARALALTEMRQGKIIRGQVGERTRELYKRPPEDLTAEAIADAEIATFNEANRLSEGITAFKEKLPSVGRFGADLLLPFVRTPSNIIKRLLEYTPLGAVRGASGVAQTLAGKVFTPAQQRSFAQSFGRGSVGTALITLGWKLHDAGLMTGLFEESKTQRARDLAAGRTPGAIRIGDTWHQVTGFSPIGNLMAIGATLTREERQDKLQGADEQEGLLDIGLDVFSQTVGEAPLAIGAQNIASALREPGSTAARLGGGIAGGFVPTLASDIGEAIDPQQRQSETLTDRVLRRIPGARQTLPAATDVLGQPRQDFGPGQAMADPTRATTDIAQQNPLFSELIRLDQGISGFTRKKGETAEQYQAKLQDFGSLYTQYGLQLVNDAQYQAASDTVKREALDALNRRIKQQLGDDSDRTDARKLSAPAIFSGLRQAEENKRKREQKQRR